jgi:ABC-type glucose/galactose transport system permease subunit
LPTLVPARSRGIESVIFDVPVRTDFFEWPLRRLALPASPSSSRCSSSSAFRIHSESAFSFYAIGAVISMSRYMSATMAQTTSLEPSTITAVAIGGVSLSGGKGSIVGVLLGTLIIGVIDNGLSITGVGPAQQAILKGAIVIFAVMLDSFSRR